MTGYLSRCSSLGLLIPNPHFPRPYPDITDQISDLSTRPLITNNIHIPYPHWFLLRTQRHQYGEDALAPGQLPTRSKLRKIHIMRHGACTSSIHLYPKRTLCFPNAV
jgi:hypothetical protein